MLLARAPAGPPQPPRLPSSPVRGWTGRGSRRGGEGGRARQSCAVCVCPRPPPSEPGVLQEGAWDVNLAAGSIFGFVFPLLPSIGGKAAFPLQSSCLAGGKPGGHPPSPPPRNSSNLLGAATPHHHHPGYGRGSRRRRGRGCLLIPGVIPESVITGGWGGRGGHANPALLPHRVSGAPGAGSFGRRGGILGQDLCSYGTC